MDALNSYVGAITKQISCEMREPDSEENSTMNKSSICDESFLKKPDDIKSTSPSPSISIPFSCQNSPLTSPKSLNSPEDELEYLLSSKVEDAFLTKKVDADGIMHPKTNAMESGLTSFECESLSLSPINVFSSTFPSGDHECTESYNYFSTEDAAYCRDIFGFGDSNDLSERITDDQYSKTGDEQRSISTYECNQYTNNIIDTSIKDTSSTKYRSPPATAPVSFQPSTKCKPLLVTPLNSFNENESSASSSADTTTQKTGISSKSYYLEGSSKNDVVWNRRFLELIEFKKVHGHTNVPQKFEKNPALGAWVARSRLQMRQMEEDEDAANNMSAVQRERVRRLKDIGLVSYLGEYSLQFDIDRIGKGAFGRTNGHLMSSRNARDWEKQFNALREYKALYGDCDVPVKSESFRSLGRWVSAQRKKYRQYSDEGTTNKPSNDLKSRFERLKEIGFNFCIGSGKSKRQRPP